MLSLLTAGARAANASSELRTMRSRSAVAVSPAIAAYHVGGMVVPTRRSVIHSGYHDTYTRPPGKRTTSPNGPSTKVVECSTSVVRASIAP